MCRGDALIVKPSVVTLVVSHVVVVLPSPPKQLSFPDHPDAFTAPPRSKSMPQLYPPAQTLCIDDEKLRRAGAITCVYSALSRTARKH